MSGQDNCRFFRASNFGNIGGHQEITLTAEQIPPMSIDLKLDGQLIYGTEGGTGTGRLTSISKSVYFLW